MIVLKCKQRSPEWVQARIGIPTASAFSKILTPKTLELSKSSVVYRDRLVAEWALGASLDEEERKTMWMERGSSMEEEAVSYYEMERGIDTEPVGFVLRDDRLVGCSPDRFVGSDGGLEIKCPSAAVHVGYLLGEVSAEFMAQVQGTLWLTGRSWWDLLSYHPHFEPALRRIERNEDYIAALESAVSAFIDDLLAARKTMEERGYIKVTRPEPPSEAETLIGYLLADVTVLKLDAGEELTLPENLRDLPLDVLRALHEEIRERRMAIPDRAVEDDGPF
jgi:hypothetical protein